jgi:hypothetical protein
VACCEDRSQNVRTSKRRKRRGVHHCHGEQSQPAQMAKHGSIVDRMRLGARREAGYGFEKE